MYIYHFANNWCNTHMTTIAEIRKVNYESLRKASGLGKGAFADKMDIAPAYISQIFSEKTDRDMGSDLARKIETLAGKPRGWMDVLHGADTDYIDSHAVRPLIESNAHETSPLGEFKNVPVVGSAQLGDNGHWDELEYPVGFGDGVVRFPTRDKNAYALRCVGDSMKPRIRNGEFVIVEPNTEPQPGDEVLVRTMDDRVMVKTLLYQRDGSLHLISINEAHPPQSIPFESVDKMHYIAAIVKKSLWLSVE